MLKICKFAILQLPLHSKSASGCLCRSTHTIKVLNVAFTLVVRATILL